MGIASKKTRLEVWSEQTINDFLNLKKALASALILEFPDCGKHFILQCDASKYSIGTIGTIF